MIECPVLKQRFFDSTGAPLASGSLYSYEAGTSTPQATYTDETGNATNANPVVLDSQGYADVWLDQNLAYKFILKDSSGNTIWTIDNVNAQAQGSIQNVRTVTVDTSILTTDNLVRSNSTSGSLTHTLPACASTNVGVQITIKDVGTGGYGTTIQGSGSDYIDGSNIYSKVLVQYDSATFVNNGTSWDVI